MTWRRFCLEPESPFYAAPRGRARKSGAVVHSDTIHAAIIKVAALTGSSLVEAPGAFRLSSVFPRVGGAYLFPRPFLPPPNVDEDHPGERKRWKSVRLVSAGVLRAWLEGHAEAFACVEPQSNGVAVFQEEAQKGLGAGPLWRAEQAPAVTVDRWQAGSDVFQRRRLRIHEAEGVGLYLLAEVAEEWAAELETALHHLGEFGLGGERSVGHGQFRLSAHEALPAEFPFSSPTDSGLAMALGLYLPTKPEVERDGVLEGEAAYDCALRGGWIDGSGRRKQVLRMCVEGSVFACPAPRGELINAAPPDFTAHPIWRSGQGLMLSFARNGG